jgi:hypothetical protein
MLVIASLGTTAQRYEDEFGWCERKRYSTYEENVKKKKDKGKVAKETIERNSVTKCILAHQN